MQNVSGLFYFSSKVENFISYYNGVVINYDFKDISNYRIFISVAPTAAVNNVSNIWLEFNKHLLA